MLGELSHGLVPTRWSNSHKPLCRASLIFKFCISTKGGLRIRPHVPIPKTVLLTASSTLDSAMHVSFCVTARLVRWRSSSVSS